MAADACMRMHQAPEPAEGSEDPANQEPRSSFWKLDVLPGEMIQIQSSGSHMCSTKFTQNHIVHPHRETPWTVPMTPVQKTSTKPDIKPQHMVG